MTNADYRIIEQADGSFRVELTRSGVLAQMATGFVTEAEAGNWIAQDKRLREAADPFRSPTGRKSRGS